MIFQIMPIVKVRASNYLARFVRYQAYIKVKGHAQGWNHKKIGDFIWA